MPSETTIARAQLAQEQERQVLAEASLAGEKRVVLVRTFIFALMTVVGVSTMHGRDGPIVGLIAIILYGLFTLVCVYRVTFRTPKADWRRAPFFHFMFPTVDFTFLTVTGWGHWVPEHNAALAALILAYALLRMPVTILYSTALAVGSYLLLSFHAGTGATFGVLSVVAGYLALGLLLWRSNAALGEMFLSLRRRDNLSRFLPPQLVEKLLGEGETALHPVQREVSVMFVDVRNFTAMSEHLQPREVLEFLDDFLGRMAQIVKAHDGIVNKFLGDGLLAFWGVPAPKADHARAALKAALDMRRDLEELNGVRAHHGQSLVRIGVGIHTGVVAAGMLGGAEQHEYTVIGDAVNLASRIEGLTKVLGVDILVSDRAWECAGPGFAGTRRGEEKVKGREEAVGVYALEGHGGAARATG